MYAVFGASDALRLEQIVGGQLGCRPIQVAVLKLDEQHIEQNENYKDQLSLAPSDWQFETEAHVVPKSAAEIAVTCRIVVIMEPLKSTKSKSPQFANSSLRVTRRSTRAIYDCNDIVTEQSPDLYIVDVPGKGEGVRTRKYIKESQFICEYAGELITAQEGEQREETFDSVYRYFFQHKKKSWCVDATEEPAFTNGNQYGRKINHGRGLEKNSKMVIKDIDSVPHLYLYATKNIFPDEEILYDYGVKKLPWESNIKVSKEDLRKSHIKDTANENNSKIGNGHNTCDMQVEVDDTLNEDTANENNSKIGNGHNTCDMQVEVDDTLNEDTANENNSKIGNGHNTCDMQVEVDDTLNEDTANENNSKIGNGHNTCDMQVEVDDTLNEDTANENNSKIGNGHNTCDMQVEVDDTLNDDSANEKIDNGLCELLAEVVDTLSEDTANENNSKIGNGHNTCDMQVEVDDTLNEDSANEKIDNGLCELLAEVVDTLSEDTANENNSKIGNGHNTCDMQVGVDDTLNEDSANEKIDNGLCELLAEVVDTLSEDTANENNSKIGNGHNTCDMQVEVDDTLNEDGANEKIDNGLTICELQAEVDDTLSEEVPDSTSSDIIDDTDDDSDYSPLHAFTSSETEYSDNFYSDEEIITVERNPNINCFDSPSELRNNSPLELRNIEMPEAQVNIISSSILSEPEHQGSAQYIGTSVDSSLRGVSVPTTSNKGRRRYDKKFYCMFCNAAVAKLPRHLKDKHNSEDDVIAYIEEKDPRIKNMKLIKIRNKGAHLHNTNVLRNREGTLQITYRSKNVNSPSKYIPCEYCLGYYSRKELWIHSKRCLLCPKTTERKRRFVQAGKLLLPTPVETSAFLKTILSAMKDDQIKTIVKNDPLLIQLGEKHLMKKGNDREQHPYLRALLRGVARLVHGLRTSTKNENLTTQELIDPKMFNKVTQMAKQISGYDFIPEASDSSSPSFALKVGFSLCKCARIVKANAIQNNNDIQKQKASEFIELYNINWADDVATQALDALHQRKRNKQMLLPLVNDVRLLMDHTKAVSRDSMTCLQKNSEDRKLWSLLAEASLTYLLIFNRRRQGEVSKLKILDYQNRHLSHDDDVIGENLSPFEQKLCSTLEIVEIRGKRGRNVPLLLTKEIVEWLNFLIEKRQQAGISLSNSYVFARGFQSQNYIRGSDSLKKFSVNCGAAFPERLRSTKLRKHIATISQIMNLKKNELDILAKFMGHDINVHREYYRLPQETVQVAKVSKLLLALEKGETKNLSGKNLDEISNFSEDVQTECHIEVDNTSKRTECHIEVDNTSKQTECRIEVDNTSKQTEGNIEDATIEQVDNIIKTPTIHTKGMRKKTWNEEERSVITKEFPEYINSYKLPGKRAIEKLIAKEPSVLKERTWKNIKDFLHNYLVSKKRKQNKKHLE